MQQLPCLARRLQVPGEGIRQRGADQEFFLRPGPRIGGHLFQQRVDSVPAAQVFQQAFIRPQRCPEAVRQLRKQEQSKLRQAGPGRIRRLPHTLPEGRLPYFGKIQGLPFRHKARLGTGVQGTGHRQPQAQGGGLLPRSGAILLCQQLKPLQGQAVLYVLVVLLLQCGVFLPQRIQRVAAFGRAPGIQRPGRHVFHRVHGSRKSPFGHQVMRGLAVGVVFVFLRGRCRLATPYLCI